MQEVVKRIQERQKPEETSPKNQYMDLCLVKAKDNQVYLVVLPNYLYGVRNGDIAVFDYCSRTIQGEVVFHSSDKEDGTIWTGLTIATGKTPARATRYYRLEECKWGDK